MGGARAFLWRNVALEYALRYPQSLSRLVLQLAVPDRLRGRVFAVELMLLALMSSFMSWATAAAFDRLGLSPQTLAKIIGLLFCLPGIAWFLVEAALRRQQTLAAAPGETPRSPAPPAVLG